ncbi:autotransporter domain-containing protein [Pseudomonas sp. MWU12-2037]|uniref:autotransporter outer membrane beta-barrel domain-containing protein n=1 Tax=Pseudomonas sp. MWU12-2037 TaxID=2928690 RepID=UPI00200E184C|nr:autotransporter domain-containing protein [Pseudomonas sp. MWU12-2037]
MTLLSMSITAALAALAPTMAMASAALGPTVISSNTTNQFSWTNSDLTVNNGVSISSGTAVSATGSSLGTLINNGSITGTGSGDGSGINNSGNIGALNNNGLIGGSAGSGIFSSGSITTLTNNAGGTISATTGINNSGTIGTLSNSGVISGNNRGIYNTGSINTLTNNVGGTLSGAGNGGLYNDSGSTIGALTNNGLISDSSSDSLYNFGSITTLTNNAGATISGYSTGIDNSGRIGTLSNSGTIRGGYQAGINNNGGNIGTLNNSGTISGSNSNSGNRGTGLYNTGTIGTLSNSGTISGTVSGTGIGYGLHNSGGTIGTLNNSGLITGSSAALYNEESSVLGGTSGVITNSGTIAGDIVNLSSQDLTIDGGTGSTFGSLTGFGGTIGTISNTTSNLVFGVGNQLLNDNINVGSFNVANQGTLQVNNTINITGNYTQAANASLILGVADNAVTTGNINTDAGYGRLVVSGSANINSGSTIGLQKLGSYGFAQGQRYVVIQANSTGTNYNADTLHYTVAGFNAAGTSVADGANTDLLVTLGTAASTAPVNQATNANGTAPLAGLFHYDGLNAGLMNLFNAAAALDSSAAGNHAGAQLSPTANASAATQASTASTVQVLNVAAAHLDGLRTAQNDSVGSGVATGESASNTGLWGQAFGGSSRLGERDDIAGYHARYSGFLLGADAALNDSWRAGGLFSYTKTTVNNDGDNSGSSADVKSYGLFGYASYQGRPWYLDLSLGAIQHQYDTQREISFSGFNGAAKGQHDGMQYIASAQAGYPIDLGPALAHAILTPIAGLTYSTLRQDSYTESGGNGAALHIDSSSNQSLKSDLGAKLERSFATSYGSVIPSAQLTWRHEYHDKGLQSVANYAADTSGATSFTSAGAKPVADTGVLTLGITLLHSENLSLGAKYTLEAANGYTANTGDVQVRWQF